ncbi:hypothetical protein BJ742DRAFT_809450 [Cladochytrium replicatum]|nr:hypothetical protein BJ742DRAFT_809450 [Cladochytrium replicatum]
MAAMNWWSIRLNATIVKVVAVIIIGGGFLAFFIKEVVDYLTAPVIVTVSLGSNETMPLPGLVFVFPFGSAAFQNVTTNPTGPGIGNLIQFTPTALGQRIPPDQALSRCFDTFSIFSNDTQHFTAVVLLPKANAPPVKQYGLLAAFEQPALDLDPVPPRLNGSGNLRQLTVMVIGSRFLSSEFGQNIRNYFNTTVRDPQYTSRPFQLSYLAAINGSTSARDVNSFVITNNFEGENRFGLNTYIYQYLNGSNEVFYDLSQTGSALWNVLPPTRIVQVTVNQQSTKITRYIEQRSKTFASLLSSVTAAFQFLMITMVFLVFGRGRYSPYGLIHRVFPEEAVKNYHPQPGADPDFDKFRYLMTSYLDTSVLERQEDGRTRNVPGGYPVPSTSTQGKVGASHRYSAVQTDPTSPVTVGQGSLGRRSIMSWDELQHGWPGYLAILLVFLAIIIFAILLLFGMNSPLVSFLVIRSTNLAGGSASVFNGNERLEVDTVYLGFYGPIFVKNGVAKLIPDVDILRVLQPFTVVPSGSFITSGSKSPSFIEDSFMTFREMHAAAPFLFSCLTVVSLALSVLIKLAALALELDFAVSIADIFVPITASVSAVFATLTFVFSLVYYGRVEETVNEGLETPLAEASFGPGMYILTVGALAAVALCLTEVFESYRIRKKKMDLAARRAVTSWLPPAAATWPRRTDARSSWASEVTQQQMQIVENGSTTGGLQRPQSVRESISTTGESAGGHSHHSVQVAAVYGIAPGYVQVQQQR